MKTRSWWGWGAVDEAVTADEAGQLVAGFAPVFPTHDFADHEPPDPESFALADPRVRPPDALQSLFSRNAADRAGHAHGKAFRDVVRNVRGDADAWRSAFLRMPYRRDALARRSVIAETFETASTWEAFDEFHASVTDAANRAVQEICGGGRISCRFSHVYSDGPAPYHGVIAPGRWDGLIAQWDDIKSAVSEAIIAAGGTITHHHAVGRDHVPWYLAQRSSVFGAALAGAKASLDPSGIMNPGVLGLD